MSVINVKKKDAFYTLVVDNRSLDIVVPPPELSEALDRGSYIKAVDLSTNKRFHEALIALCTLILRDPMPIYYTSIFDMELKMSTDDIRLLQSYCAHRMFVSHINVPYPKSTKPVFLLFPDVSEDIPVKTILKKTPNDYISAIEDKACTMVCDGCSKLMRFHYSDDVFICPCGYEVFASYDKRSQSTYVDELSARLYVMKTVRTRFADLYSIVVNVPASKRCVFPGDGVGLGALVCHLMGRRYLSCEISPIMRRYVNSELIVNAHANKHLNYEEGDVVIVSHVLDLDPSLKEVMTTKDFVCFERATLLMTEIPGIYPISNLYSLKISGFDVWKSIPIKLSVDHRRVKYHQVMTKYYDPAVIFYATDAEALRLLNFWAITAGPVKVYPTPQVVALPVKNFDICADGYPVHQIFKKRLVVSPLFAKTIDLRTHIENDGVPWGMSDNVYDADTLLPVTPSSQIVAGRVVIISDGENLDYPCVVPGPRHVVYALAQTKCSIATGHSIRLNKQHAATLRYRFESDADYRVISDTISGWYAKSRRKRKMSDPVAIPIKPRVKMSRSKSSEKIVQALAGGAMMGCQ